MPVTTILIFVAVLVVLILVHEFGHFMTAKKLGFRVDEFGIGFPPKLASRWFGQTEYSVNALPFGGFVRIFGENPEEVDASSEDAPRAFSNRPRWAQALVLIAGVVFNALFAWFLFTVALSFGMQVPADYPAFGEVHNAETVVVGQVVPESPAAQAGITSGSTIVSVSVGSDVRTEPSPAEIADLVQAYPDTPITVTYVLRGASDTVQQDAIQPERGLPGLGETPAIGIATQAIGTLQLPPHLAVLEGGRLAADMLVRITVAFGMLIGNLVQGTADLSGIAGPVGIAALVGDVSSDGFVPLLSFTAFISLNLAILNLIPFPALDGGRLLLVGVEAVRRKAVNPSIVQGLNVIGFALLILLMLVVTYRDIIRIAG